MGLQLHRFYSVEWDGDIIMKSEKVRI